MSFPNPDPNSPALADLAERIDEIFCSADEALRVAEDATRLNIYKRVEAGRLLVEARKLVEASGQLWTKWCAANLKRSMGDIRKCIELASAKDPEAAVAKEREKARAGMAAIREKRANVSALERDERERIYHYVLTRPDQPRFPIPPEFAGYHGEHQVAVGFDSVTGEMTIRGTPWRPDASYWLRNVDKLIPLVSPDGEGYWLMPPELRASLDAKYGPISTFDPCPYPRPPLFDGLTEYWGLGRTILLNMPFKATNEKNGRGPMAWIKKAIEQQGNGNTILLTFPPLPAHTAELARAEAEMESLGRVRWLHTVTGEPRPDPSETMLFVLRGKWRKLENRPFSFSGARLTRHREDKLDVAPVVEVLPEPVSQDRPKVPVEVRRQPAPRPEVWGSKYCALSTGCQYPRLCRNEGGCREANASLMAEASA